MPTDDIQNEHPEPDSPSGIALSQNMNIPEIWNASPHTCNLHLQDDRWTKVISPSLEADFWSLIDKIPEVCDGAILHFGCIWTDASQIAELNETYRQKDKPTNVLSFPDGETDPETGEMYLGDIFLCWDVISEEASNQDIPFHHHTLHLMLHGVLHLLGYDHIDAEDAAEMESIETALLTQIGIENPYSEPAIQSEVAS